MIILLGIIIFDLVFFILSIIIGRFYDIKTATV